MIACSEILPEFHVHVSGGGEGVVRKHFCKTQLVNILRFVGRGVCLQECEQLEGRNCDLFVVASLAPQIMSDKFILRIYLLYESIHGYKRLSLKG